MPRPRAPALVVLPGGTKAAALHLARTIARRAERLMVALADEEPVGARRSNR